jgi:hypothetical protein
MQGPVHNVLCLLPICCPHCVRHWAQGQHRMGQCLCRGLQGALQLCTLLQAQYRLCLAQPKGRGKQKKESKEAPGAPSEGPSSASKMPGKSRGKLGFTAEHMQGEQASPAFLKWAYMDLLEHLVTVVKFLHPLVRKELEKLPLTNHPAQLYVTGRGTTLQALPEWLCVTQTQQLPHAEVSACCTCLCGSSSRLTCSGKARVPL